MPQRTPIHDRLSTLADPTRGRVLLALEGHELTVTELCSVLQIPQSTVSRHLRVLGDDGWITSRQDGTSRYYARSAHLESAAVRLWEVVREDLRGSTMARHDSGRLTSVLTQRRSKSREFFATSADRWDSVRVGLFGENTDLIGLLGLLDDEWTVGDLGCGTGRLSALVAPNVKQIIAVDESPEMLLAARQRLAGITNVDLRQGELELLPIEPETLDAAILSLVLHYAAEPARAFTAVHRTLKRGGRLLIVDMLPHEQLEYRQEMGHVWLGFPESQMNSWLQDAGFERVRIHPLPADPAAKGPTLFVASATKRLEPLRARGGNGTADSVRET